jgi:asparagine synthase (glutamine-hydrolysing)
MCGVVAKAGLVPQAVDPTVLAHRGPDGNGVAQFCLGPLHVTLGGTRLAIVGGSGVPIPFIDRASQIAVAYNGEIYNWRALRAELGDGVPWQTECDVEVLTRAWRRWGVNALTKLNGMFAFVLVDLLDKTVYAVRDRAGEKPLYYARDGAWNLCFASEIKALGVPLVLGPCEELEALEFDCLEKTPFAGVLALEPGHFLTMRGKEDVDLRCWWKLPEASQQPVRRAIVDDLTALVHDAVSIRANAEVPVAVLLSGGLDSAIIQAVAKSEHLYTIDFDGEALGDATIAAGGQSVQALRFDLEDAVVALPQIAWHLDTPATWTALAQWFLARRIARDGNRIVLSGEGADELFGGYARYKMLRHLDSMSRDPWLANYDPLRTHLLGSSDEVLARMLTRNPRGASAVMELVNQFSGSGSLVRRAMRLDWHTTMQVLLRMLDRMMMAWSLEGRCPFLDHRIIEAAAAMPDSWLVGPDGTKLVLRGVARRLGVPERVVASTNKRGFSVPWNTWTGAKPSGSRGAYDRSGFAAAMQSAWLDAFPQIVSDTNGRSAVSGHPV